MSFLGVRSLAAAVMIVGLMAASWGAQAADFIVKGTGLDGAAYQGRVATDVVGDTVKVVWLVDGARYVGNGVIYDNALAVYFTGPTTGVAIYKYDTATGVWRGRWTTAGANKAGTEDWIPVNR